ncbi:hypothetical protein BH24ACT25_BH24ACT25_05670 [soil metagenome]|jgi:hypothetical protein
MRMQRSLAQIERDFEEEAVEERERRSRLRNEAARRSRTRRSERVEKQGTLRFAGLVAAILLTSVIVTILMFESLSLLIAP